MELKYVLLFSVLLPFILRGQSKATINFNPTGLYKKAGKEGEKFGETYGFYGEIKVKSLNHSTIALTLFLTDGAPSYHIEEVWDTLKVIANVATFISDDSTYKFTFTLKKTNILVHRIGLELSIRNRIFVGSFIKVSGKVPIIDDPLKG